jgi:hypothetical protein
MTDKVLLVDFSNGEQWAIPLIKIIKHRALYLFLYRDELSLSLAEIENIITDIFERDFKEAIDWAQNNMNWGDVCEHAKKVSEKSEECNYQDMWCNPVYSEIGSL